MLEMKYLFKKILLAGHIGKFIKLSAGIFNTHSKVADARNEILIANLALMGASTDLVRKIDACLTTEEATDIVYENGFDSKVADARNEILIANLALMGASTDLVRKIDACLTTEEATDIVYENGFGEQMLEMKYL